jgi:hypothetical protein
MSRPPTKRRLTVSSTSAEQRASHRPRPLLAPMPFLRLRGRWLASAGFAIGASVRVAVAHGLLVLEVLNHDECD